MRTELESEVSNNNSRSRQPSVDHDGSMASQLSHPATKTWQLRGHLFEHQSVASGVGHPSL